MCSVGWSCGVGRRSLVLRAFRPAAGSVADLCWGVERARRSQPLRRSLPFHPRHARLSTPLLIERWQMAGMGSSWGRHTVRLPSLGGVLGPGLLLATDTARPSAPPPASASRDGKWLVWGRAGGGIPCVCHLSMGCRFRTPAGYRHRPHPSAPDPALGTAAPRHRAPASAPPPASAPRDCKWLLWGRAGGGIPCVCHLSVGAGLRTPAAPRHRTRTSAPRAPLNTAAPRHCARLSIPRDGKWLEWGRAGAGIPCVCHLSAREPGGARVRKPVGPW